MKLSSKQKGIAAFSVLSAAGIAIGIYHFLNAPLPKPVLESEVIELGIHEPIKNGVPFEIMKFNASEGLIYHRPNGTHIEIPANSIVDKNGQKVEGEVEFRFREMHEAKEIFLSGIPMQMSEDRSKYLESMGMVEMRVFNGDEEMGLKEGSEVSVDIASNEKPDKNFKLWYLSENQSWEQKGTFLNRKNTRRDTALANLPKLPKKPRRPKKEIVFQLASDDNMPHLRTWDSVDWQLLSSHDEDAIMRAMRVNWDKISIELINNQKKQFRITFASNKNDHKGNIFRDSITVEATPDINRKDMVRLMAQYETALQDFTVVLQKREKEEERIMQESAMLNSFTANGFGIYNIDKLKQTQILAKINASFDFQKDVDSTINRMKLIMICKKQNTVLTYYPSEWKSLPVIDDEVELVASLPDGSFAYISNNSFLKQLNKNDISPYFENKRGFSTKKLMYEDLRTLML
jgi:hypothetical protein